jgi:hypothetical protein
MAPGRVIMRVSAVVCAIAVAGWTGAAVAGDKLHVAQSSTTTNCMVSCNAQWATCQASCIVPGSAPTGAATSTSNANASSSCLINCGSQQMSCQSSCALASPSQ